MASDKSDHSSSLFGASLLRDYNLCSLVIVQGPMNITVFDDQPAKFTCVVTGGHISWAVNGSSLSELHDIASPGDFTRYALCFPHSTYQV